MSSEAIRPRYITPTLPAKAGFDIAAWSSKSRYHRTFIRPLMQIDGVFCKNCVDADFVMVSFVRAGPFGSVPNHGKGETLTWFDGDEKAGKGWYIIKYTVSYDCPMCRPEGDRLESPKETLDKVIQEDFPWQNYTG